MEQLRPWSNTKRSRGLKRQREAHDSPGAVCRTGARARLPWPMACEEDKGRRAGLTLEACNEDALRLLAPSD